MKRFTLTQALVLTGPLLGSVAVAGTTGSAITAASRNPLANSRAAIAAGEALSGKMHCTGCHGANLTGGMGPDLTDRAWLRGARPGEIFLVISNGTPNGMPKWNDKLKPAEIWQLVTYIQSKAAP